MLTAVLLLSLVLGGDVLGPTGRPLGRLADLVVRLDGTDPESVTKIAVRRRNASTVLLPWEEVEALRGPQLVLATDDLRGFEVAVVADELADDEILLGRDVLDTQVVDVVGQRLARVADVLLAPEPRVHWEVVGVEVGFGGVLRRLGLGATVPSGLRDVVAWRDLHLTSERGHSVQLSASRAAVHRLNPRALASLVSRVDTASGADILTTRSPAAAAEAVRAAHPDVGERLLRAMPEHLSDRIVAAMPQEHAHHWRRRLSHTPALMGRRFLRSRVWPHRHHLGERR